MSAVADRIARPSSRPDSDLLLAGGLLAVTCAAVLDPAHVQQGPVLCPLRLVTGLPCPGCGGIRAWTAAVHGDVAAALAYNPFATILLGVVLGLALWRVATVFVPRASLDAVALWRTTPARAFVLVWACWGVVRAIAGT